MQTESEQFNILCFVMYKRFFITLLLAGALVLSVNAQRRDDIKGAHPWKTEENKQIATDYSHWSLLFNAGFNSFDGDFNAEMLHPVYAPALGLDVEYAFNPFLALGVNYMFDIYRVTGNTKTGDNADILLRGMMHRGGAYLAVDLMNCFYPRAERKIFSFQLLAGGGAGWFKNSTYFLDDSRSHTGSAEPLKMDSYKGRPYLLGGVNFEFNLSRGVALGIKGTYSYFTKDDIDGRGYQGLGAVASKNNDGIFDVTLNLRYKIDAVHKTHVRNITSYYAVDQQLAANELDKRPKSIDTGARRDTVVVIHKDTVVMQSKVSVEKPEESYFVYFETGKSALTSEGLITIQQVAARLERNKQRYAVVMGYCDNTGSDNINNILGEKRAEEVMNELIEEYGISADRITACGYGRVIGKRSKAAYGPNRRAEIRIVTREEFEQMKAECAEGRINTSMSLNNDTDLETLADAVLDKVAVSKNMTLSQLARHYYQNTHCWIFIYQANRKVISNPNALTTGTELVIPGLTEAQRTITKDKCLDIYKKLRANK